MGCGGVDGAEDGVRWLRGYMGSGYIVATLHEYASLRLEGAAGFIARGAGGWLAGWLLPVAVGASGRWGARRLLRVGAVGVDGMGVDGDEGRMGLQGIGDIGRFAGMGWRGCSASASAAPQRSLSYHYTIRVSYGYFPYKLA